ncbi:MAG: BamA/TamA family outer membrane protein [Candidatus Gastranaerophilales bacterium]|nr:BamA/TamA family outer membrane protein [Candidatus Gastranaerophilales bacterium]
MNRIKLIFGVMCFVVIIYCGHSVSAADFDNPAGIINTHVLNTIFELEKEREMQKDFDSLKKDDNGDTQNDVKKDDKTKEDKLMEGTVEKTKSIGVMVKNIEVPPSEILTDEEIKSIVDKYEDEELTIEELQEVVNEINKLYLSKGFVTARAYLPEQKIAEGKVQILLIEGKVGDIKVNGNKWTRESFIKKRIELNCLETGKIFNIGTLEDNINNFNRYNNGVQLKGTLLPGGLIDGTTDIVLEVDEKSPFHVSAIMDNGGRESIGKLRGGLILQDDSLFGFRDKLTIGAYANKASVTPFADYNIPVNKKDGRLGFMFSSGFSDIAYGQYSDFDIKSRSYIYSLYFNQPLIRKPYMELSSISSLNYKHATTIFDGEDLYTNKLPSAETGLAFRYDTKRGIWYLNQNVGYTAPIFDSEANYVKIDGGVTRLHDFGHGVIGQFRGNYQVIPADVVPSIDQFQLGGMYTVRGYSEGLIIGRSGYMLSGELMVPILPRTILSKDKTKRVPFLGKYVKGIVFIDHGMVFPYKGSGEEAEGLDSSDVMLSVGLGLKILLPGDVTAKLAWGFPCIQNKYETGSKWGRFHFDINLSPDFDMLLKLRKPKNEKV